MNPHVSVRPWLTAAVLLLLSPLALAETIAVIGTGEVGKALGPEFAAQGHTIVYGSRDPDRADIKVLIAKTGDEASAMLPAEAVEHADIVVLAVPGMLVSEIVLGLGDLSEKIIIDPTNPLIWSETGIEFGVETSNAEIIQGLAPAAYVVKAFSTLNWRDMVEPESSGGPISIPLTGNSDTAKRAVASIIEKMGLEPIDVGPVENSHWVEGMTMLYLRNRRASDRPGFDFHLRKVAPTE
ncbi:MAG: NAD(P)-binding domain-containing protein [Pseudomonadota bacterium]